MRRNNSIFENMRRMQERMDNLFDDFFSEDPFLRNTNLLTDGSKKDLVKSNYRQAVSDIYETEKEVIAEIEIPGVDKKDIKVHVGDDGIEVKAESNAEVKHEDRKKGIYRFERNYSGFSRFISLPNNVDSKNSNAEYKNGILKITVPKLKVEEHKKKLLEVK